MEETTKNNDVNFGNDWFGLGDNSLTPTPTSEQLSSMSQETPVQGANEGVKQGEDFGSYNSPADYSFLSENSSETSNVTGNVALRDEIKNTEFNLQPENEESDFQIGKKKKEEDDTVWSDAERDDRSFWEKAKGFGKTAGKALYESGKGLVNEFFSGYMGTDLMDAIQDTINNLILPDKTYVTINGNNYNFNQNEDTQNEIMYLLEDLSDHMDEVDDFYDLLEKIDASFQMNNAIASMKSADLISLPGQYTLRGSNVKGMAKASEDLLSMIDAKLTPEYLDTLSTDEIAALTQVVLMNTTYSGLGKSKSISSITGKLGDRPGVREGYEAIKEDHQNALAQARDKSNSKFAGDVVMDALLVGSLASSGWKATSKALTKASSKYGLMETGNATEKALSNMMEKMQTLQKVEAENAKILNNPAMKMLDPKGYEKASKAVKQAERELKAAERSFSLKSKIGDVADKFVTSPKLADSLAAGSEAAAAAGDTTAAKALGSGANLGKGINLANAAAGVVGATKIDDALDNSNKVEKVAEVLGKGVRAGAALATTGKTLNDALDLDKKDENIRNVASSIEEKQAQKEIEKEKERVAAIKEKYNRPDYGVTNDWAKIYKEKLDAIDVSTINTDNFKALKNDLYKTLQDLQKDAKNQIDMIAESFFREGASLDNFTSSEVYKTFSQDVYNLSQDIYDKAETINHSAATNIQRDYASTSSKISAAFDKLGNKISNGKDELTDATLAIEYLDSLDAVIDASKALMKSAAYNGAQNTQGGKYAEAWKKDTAIDKLSAKEWVASAATGTIGLLGIIGGSVIMAANPIVGGALFALGLAGTTNKVTKMSLGAKSFTNEEQMFSTDSKGLKLYNSLLEPANIGDTKAASTYTKLLSGASKIGKGISSLDPSTVASGIYDIYQVESGGLSGRGRELYNNMYQFANIWDEINGTDFESLYHSDPKAAKDEIVTIASSYGTSDDSNAADAKYSGYREEAVNSNLAKDYNEGMEKETNEAVSDKYVKVFKVMLDKEPDYIRKVLIAIPKNHSEVEW